MAASVSLNGRIYLGAFNLSGYSNRMGVDASTETHDTTVFTETSRSRTSGLHTARFTAAGFYAAGAGTPDAVAAAYLGTAGIPLTLCPDGDDVGDMAYVLESFVGEYQPLASTHGQPIPYTITGDNSGAALGRGYVLGNGAVTATGDGTAVQAGAVTASQRMYAALHVLEADGTATIKLQSDDGSGFATPTDRATFAEVSAAGYEWLSVDGAVTDTYWRFSVSAFTGTSITFVLAVGVGPA